MEVIIGFRQSTRDLNVETAARAEEIRAQIAKALEPGGILTLKTKKGGDIIAAGEAIAFVEIREAENRRVGFGL